MTVQIPVLDPMDEEEIVASVIDAFPASITDRSRAAPEVAIAEALGALYGAATFNLNQWPDLLRARHLLLLGYAPDPATPAVAVLTFTASGAGATIPAGTVVRTGATLEALRFITDAELVVAPSGSGAVNATSSTSGASSNATAGMITRLETPVAGVVSVTNIDPATGGADAEALGSLEARLPALLRTGGGRVVTGEDAEQAALAIPGVERALVLGERGALTAHLLLADLNAAYQANIANAPNVATRAAVQSAIVNATVPGVAVAVAQPTIKLLHLRRVEVQLVAGYASAAVKSAILAAWNLALTAVTIYGADGVTVVQEGWAWGASLYRNEMISLIDSLPGVRRVGRIWISESVDYGVTWGGEVELVEVEAWANGAPNAVRGLLSSGLDGTNPLTLDLL